MGVLFPYSVGTLWRPSTYSFGMLELEGSWNSSSYLMLHTRKLKPT